MGEFSAAYITSPTHPELKKGSGCVARIRTALWVGFSIGVVGTLAYSGSQAIRYGIRGRELLFTVTKQSINNGVTVGGIALFGRALLC